MLFAIINTSFPVCTLIGEDVILNFYEAVLFITLRIYLCEEWDDYIYSIPSSRRTEVGQIQGGCRGPAKIRQRGVAIIFHNLRVKNMTF